MLRFALPAAMAFASLVTAQGVITPGGTPDPNYPFLWAWFDAAQGLNSSATPLPHGTAVTQWDDRGARGRHLTLSSSDPTRRPTAVDDVSSCGPALRFDGNDFIWGSTTTIGRCTGARTIFIVARVDAADGGYLMDGSTASGRSTLHAGETARPGIWHVFSGDSTQPAPNGYFFTSSNVETARYSFHTVRIEPNRQEHFVDGRLVGSASDPFAFNLGGLILGSRYNTANGLRGDIREVLIYEESLSASDQSAIETYLATRHPYGYGSPYGSGCPGSSTLTPRLDVVGCPTPGAAFEMALIDGAANTPCIVNFALSRVSIPIGGTCEILAAPILASVGGVTDGTGRFSFQLTVPAMLGPTLLPTQAIVVDPPASPFGIAVSNGNELRIF